MFYTMKFSIYSSTIMRVGYVQPSTSHFDQILANSFHGGGINDIRIYRHYNKGGSIFGVLGAIAKKALPFLRGLILPEVGNFVKNITEDVSNNVPVKKSLKSNAAKSVKNVGRRIFTSKNKGKPVKKNNARKKPRVRVQGGGKTKPGSILSNSKSGKLCKPKHKDIFD